MTARTLRMAVLAAGAVLLPVTAAALLFPAAALADPKPDPGEIITLQIENDAVSTLKGTSDQYYTSGLKLGWVGATGQMPDFLSRAGRAVYGPMGTQRLSLDISQSVFTPRNTQIDPPDPHDRPYAGSLMATGQLITDTDRRRTILGVGIGVIGHIAGGEAVQNGFHNAIGDTDNKGWGYQLRDQPVVQFTSTGIWRLPTGTVGDLETDALPTVQLGLGNYRDYLLAGVNFRIGQGLGSDFGAPRIQPGMSGSDAYTPVREFTWYAFGGFDGQAVAHDITFDGNDFSNGPHVSKKWGVAEMNAGVGVIWSGVRVTYTHTFRTEEFHGQKGGLFNFGSLAASMRF